MQGRNDLTNYILAFAGYLGAAGNVSVAAVYSVTDLGSLSNPPGGNEARPNAINLPGKIAAANAQGGVYQAFLYDAGWIPLGTLGGAAGYATGINDTDQVVGYSTIANGARRAFLWTRTGTDGVAGNRQMKDLGILGGNQSEAYGVNNSGQVTGYSQTIGRDHAFRLSGGTMTDIGVLLSGSKHSYGFDINNPGHVAGTAYNDSYSFSTAFFYNGTAVLEIPGWGGDQSSALSINDNDVIAGYATTIDGRDHATRYTGGVLLDLGTLGGRYSYGVAINNSNIVVGGSYTDANDTVYHAFVSDGNSMTDLNSQLDATGADWSLIEARAINDAGQIAGVGRRGGVNHGFVLSLVTAPPAPSITSVKTEGSDVVFSFTTVLTANYSIEARPGTASGNWSEAVGAIPGTGSVMTATNLGGQNLPTRFYRVKSVSQ